MESNKKKKLLIGLSIFIVIVALAGVTYSFFNYTIKGPANTISVGRMYFETSQTTINLTNLAPIDPTVEGALNDSTNVGTAVIAIEGDTDYSDGIEYLVTTVDTNITANGKTVPIGLDITVSNLGTESSNYFTARKSKNATIYKQMVDGTLEGNKYVLVGYIKPNTTLGTIEGANGSITIKAYLDRRKILITDTYNNGNTPTDNLATPTSMAEDKVVFTTEEWDSFSENNVISFKVRVEAREGIWVEEPGALGLIKKNVITPTNPINFANISSDSNGKGLYILPGTENSNPIYYYRGAVTNNNVIFGDYCWQMVRTTDTGGIKMIYNGAVTGNGETCENTSHADRIISSSAFNSQHNSLSDVGYMYNKRYVSSTTGWTTDALFASSATWVTDHYELTDASVTTPNSTHHYSCNETTAEATCTDLRYVYYLSGTTKYYIVLTNGELIEDALYKMTGNGTDIVKQRNEGYVLNQNNSTAKTTIENWFKTNLTNEVDSTKRNYQAYLEDTVFCNDRSFKTVTGSSNFPTYNQSGWKSNGGSLSKFLYFGSYNRFRNYWYSTTNVPTTACPREIDSFSVNSSVAHLNYPVGLLTADEIIMAGSAGDIFTSNTSHYLYTGGYYWSLSPHYFTSDDAGEFYFGGNGYLGASGVEVAYGLRPVISLKPGTEFETGGEGTKLKPYVVKYD